jgi:hypothetical protein
MNYSEKQLQDLENVKSMLMDDGAQVGSIFNERLHSTFTPDLITRLSFAPQVAKKTLWPLLLSFPFNPFTGEEDERFNAVHRNMIFESPENVILTLFREFETNSELKRRYQSKTDYMGEWDTSGPDQVHSDATKEILWRYRRPLVFSFPSMTINKEAITGSKYTQTFLLDAKQDEMTGEFIGQQSDAQKIGLLVGQMVGNELTSLKKAMETKSLDSMSREMGRNFALVPDYIEKLGAWDSEEAREAKSQIRRAYPVGKPSPMVVPIGFQVNVAPVTGSVHKQVGQGQYELYPDFTEKKSFEEMMCYRTGFVTILAINNIIGNYHPKNPLDAKTRNPETDLYVNFAILDYVTDDTRTEIPKEERGAAAIKTILQTEKKPLFDVTRNDGKGGFINKQLPEFLSRMAEFFTSGNRKEIAKTIQGKLLQTFKPMTPELTNSTMTYMQKEMPFSSALFTPAIKITHSEILQDMYPEDYAEAAADLALNNPDVNGDEIMDKLVADANSVESEVEAAAEEMAESKAVVAANSEDEYDEI